MIIFFTTIMLKEQKSFLKSFSRNVNKTKNKFESNYFPDEIAMSMKDEEQNREIIGIIDDGVDDLGNAILEYYQKFKIIRPLNIYPYQKVIFLLKNCTLFHLLMCVYHGCFGQFHLCFCMLNHCGILFQNQKCDVVYGKDT